MKAVGRPRKAVPTNARSQIENLASTGASMVEIAGALGIGRDLLRQWVAQDEDLSVALARGRERERQALHGRLFRAAMEGNVIAALFLLKSRHAGYDDRSSKREVAVDPAEIARQIREALTAIDSTIGRPN